MTHASPKVSIVMSVYNGEEFLKESIESILNQTYSDFEFLIVNDGSKDSSKEIILSFKDSRIILIDNEQNLGLVPSLNKGILSARGEYIARQDADDISLPMRLEKEVSVLDENKDTGVVGAFFDIIDEKNEILHKMTLSMENSIIKKRLLRHNQFAHGSVMMRKQHLDKVGFYRQELRHCEDYDLWLRLFSFCDFMNIPETLYQWRINFGSISVNQKIVQNKCVAWALQLHKERQLSGTDVIQRGNCHNFDNPLDLMSSLSNKHTAQGYTEWGVFLLTIARPKEALNFFYKSFHYYKHSPSTWIYIIFASFIFLIPRSLLKKINNIGLKVLLRKS